MVAADDAAATLLDLFETCGDAFFDKADGFTCDEADTIAVAAHIAGRADWAETFLAAHAASDEPGDAHCPIAAPDPNRVLTVAEVREQAKTWPKPTPGSQMIMCPVCEAAGLPGGRWIDGHTEHVQCLHCPRWMRPAGLRRHINHAHRSTT